MDLKPCPFCGGEPELKRIFRHYYVCICTECDRGTNAFRDENEAVEAWNRRASDVH